MYVAGCLGDTSRGEAFPQVFQLSNDTAYADARALPELNVLALRVMGEQCLTAIPYYAWANRGVNGMHVWIKE